MKILILLSGVLGSVLVYSCSQENKVVQVRRNETAYFRNFEIRIDPVRVYDEIPRERVLDGYEERYSEAKFDSNGLIERLRLVAGTNIIWEASYKFYDTKKIAAETWIEAGVIRTRLISAKGVVTNEVYKPVEKLDD